MADVKDWRDWVKSIGENKVAVFVQVLHVLHFMRHFAHKPTPFIRFDLVIYFSSTKIHGHIFIIEKYNLGFGERCRCFRRIF